MRIDLNGEWQFRDSGNADWLPAKVPGCNFLDLLSNGLIPDPFIGVNESKVQWVGEKDWEYRRSFTIDKETLNKDIIELSAESLDTLASVFINEQLAIIADNAHRTYIADIKPFVKEGENSIHIIFLSPNKFIKEGQKLNKYPVNSMGLPGVPHIRKNQSHFGWDWGPVLPLSGITRDIYINVYSNAKITDVRVTQEHYPNYIRLDLDITAMSINEENLKTKILLTAPNGTINKYFAEIIKHKGQISINVDNPALWEANGMSERNTQPLYKIEVSLFSDKTLQDTKALNIGLRTIRLNQEKDKWGKNFQFIINDTPIFIRGANWIPADSFSTRLTAEKMEYLIRSAKDANMNMLRVWGGGYYESNLFYDLCDKYGILVWQDFGFACMPYNFDNLEFFNNVKNEVIDNVIRLRNRPSLSLWCGNNEIEAMSKLWFYRKDFINSSGVFFHKILPEWVKTLDNVTPYWYGSPNSGEYLKNVNSDNSGDTHLWQVWHGLKPYNYYRRRFTRFCSEFGFESLPDIETVKDFAEEKDFDLQSEVMLAHQKCRSGNNKILFYLVNRFRVPKKFIDLIYLSQLSQMECVRDATEHWRRNTGRCNGAMFWQLDDCWPVSSWASIDYNGRWKALQYAARRFNSPIALSIDDDKTMMKVSLTNDTIKHFDGNVSWSVMTFDGKILDSGKIKVNCVPSSSMIVFEKDFKLLLVGKIRKNTVFIVKLDDDMMSIRTALFVKEKDSQLSKPDIIKNITNEKGKAVISLISDKFVRYAMIKIKEISSPLSDNYFDLIPNIKKTVEVNSDREIKEEDIEILSIADCEPKQSRLRDNLLRLRIRLKPVNILFAIAQALS